MKNFITALKGAALGTAFVIPGFSGGTMAVILKIYDRLLDAISLNIEKLKKNFGFILFLVIGMAAGVFATAVGLSWLFENHPVPTALTLTGIVVGSLPMIWKECTSESKFEKHSYGFVTSASLSSCERVAATPASFDSTYASVSGTTRVRTNSPKMLPASFAMPVSSISSRSIEKLRALSCCMVNT